MYNKLRWTLILREAGNFLLFFLRSHLQGPCPFIHPVTIYWAPRFSTQAELSERKVGWEQQTPTQHRTRWGLHPAVGGAGGICHTEVGNKLAFLSGVWICLVEEKGAACNSHGKPGTLRVCSCGQDKVLTSQADGYQPCGSSPLPRKWLNNNCK